MNFSYVLVFGQFFHILNNFLKSENTEHEQWNSNDSEMCSINTEPLNETEEINVKKSASSNQITVITKNAASRAYEDKHISSNERCVKVRLS